MYHRRRYGTRSSSDGVRAGRYHSLFCNFRIFDLVLSECDQRINGCGAESREQDGEDRRAPECGDRAEIGAEIPGADPEKKFFEKPREDECAREPRCKSDRDQPQSLADDETDDIAGAGAQRSPDRQFLAPLSDEIGEQTEDADRGEQ